MALYRPQTPPPPPDPWEELYEDAVILAADADTDLEHPKQRDIALIEHENEKDDYYIDACTNHVIGEQIRADYMHAQLIPILDPTQDEYRQTWQLRRQRGELDPGEMSESTDSNDSMFYEREHEEEEFWAERAHDIVKMESGVVGTSDPSEAITDEDRWPRTEADVGVDECQSWTDAFADSWTDATQNNYGPDEALLQEKADEEMEAHARAVREAGDHCSCAYCRADSGSPPSWMYDD